MRNVPRSDCPNRCCPAGSPGTRMLNPLCEPWMDMKCPAAAASCSCGRRKFVGKCGRLFWGLSSRGSRNFAVKPLWGASSSGSRKFSRNCGKSRCGARPPAEVGRLSGNVMRPPSSLFSDRCGLIACGMLVRRMRKASQSVYVAAECFTRTAVPSLLCCLLVLPMANAAAILAVVFAWAVDGRSVRVLWRRLSGS